MTEELQLPAEPQAIMDALMQLPLMQSDEAQLALQQLQTDLEAQALFEELQKPPH
jgi:hypothetical protein